MVAATRRVERLVSRLVWVAIGLGALTLVQVLIALKVIG